MAGKWLTSKTLALCLTCALLAWLGIGIPLHFRSVSPLLLERAARNTPDIQGLCSDYTMAGRTGPVLILWETHVCTPGERERIRVLKLLSERPDYWLSGGPAPYFEAYVGLLPQPPKSERGSNVIDALLPAKRRDILLQYLSGSTNNAVQELLKARNLTGWKSFLPVSGKAGQPLDASILTLALLAQGDNLHADLARQIPDIVNMAAGNDRFEQDRLEELLLATLTIGRRLNWNQMAELFKSVHSPEDLSALARRLVTEPDNFPHIYATALLCKESAPMMAYLDQYPEKGMDALKRALPMGQGALKMLFDEGKELYEAPAPVRWADRHFGHLRPDFLLDYTLHNPRQAFYLKLLLVFSSGYALALAISRILRLIGVLTHVLYRRKGPLLVLENVFVASAFTIILWMVAEPNLLRFSTENPARPMIFETGAAIAAAIIPQTNAMNANSLDQAAVLSLLLFFFLQLIVYVFCLLRISRLRSMKVPPATKIRLLENEDNLFDLGLYVGLSGTVASLVMLAMNIVQASLIAAYASTLFGIIVTALLKIVHIRPFRRRLILETQGEPEPVEQVASQEV